MTSLLEYDFGVRGLIAATVAAFALSVTAPQLTWAQAGASGNFGGHVVTGTAPAVSGAVRPSTGSVRPPTGSVNPPTGSGPVISTHVHGSHTTGEHRHRRSPDAAGPLWYAIPVPYAVDFGSASDQPENATDNDQDPNYQGGPTVFDRRGSGPDSYVAPIEDADAHSSDPADDPAPTPTEPTVLVFKDGHKIEVVNFAIVGATLFDMTPGHARRVPLSDLDLDATRQQDEDRGVTFQLPMSSQAN